MSNYEDIYYNVHYPEDNDAEIVIAPQLLKKFLANHPYIIDSEAKTTADRTWGKNNIETLLLVYDLLLENFDRDDFLYFTYWNYSTPGSHLFFKDKGNVIFKKLHYDQSTVLASIINKQQQSAAFLSAPARKNIVILFKDPINANLAKLSNLFDVEGILREHFGTES